MEAAEGKGEDSGEATDETLKDLEQKYLRDLKLQGVENIRKVWGREGGGAGSEGPGAEVPARPEAAGGGEYLQGEEGAGPGG